MKRTKANTRKTKQLWSRMVRYQYLTWVFVFFLQTSAFFATAQGYADMTPKAGAYENYFPYFSSDSSSNPSWSALLSKSIVGPLYPETAIGLGTASIIRTFRSDKKVCMCMAGHQAYKIAFSRRNDIPSSKFDLIMNYLGRNNDGRNETISGDKTTLHNAELVAYHYELFPPAGIEYAPDIALFLVNSDELIPGYVEAGYTFEPLTTSSSLVTLGYPHNLPLKIAKGLQPTAVASPIFKFSGQQPNYLAPGYSGSPMFKAGDGKIVGIFDGALNEEPNKFIPIEEMILPDIPASVQQNWTTFTQATKSTYLERYGILYAETGRATYLSFIQDTIKKYCWSGKPSVAQTREYETSLVKENTDVLQQFQQQLNIGSSSQLIAAASQEFLQTYPGNVLLRADNLNASYEIIPNTTYQKFLILAKTTNLSAGFSFTASGDYELDINSLVMKSSAARRGSNENIDLGYGNISDRELPLTSKMCYVSPNPSSSGIYTLNCSESKKDFFKLIVTDMSGKEVATQLLVNETVLTIDLSKNARGVYVAYLYDSRGKCKYQTKLIYR